MKQFSTDVEFLVKNQNGQLVSFDGMIATGQTVYFTDRSENILDSVKVSLSGDLNSDGYVDAFDLSIAGEYINTFTQPDDAAFMYAVNIYDDGFIDATDLAYFMYISNFEL